MFRQVVRGACLAGLALGCAVACGGSTSGSSPDGGAGSGAAGGGGTAAGGGFSGGGGALTGGTAGTGGAVGTGGGAGNAFSSCNGPGQCRLFPTNCCGYCSEPKLSGFVGVNVAETKAANAFYCSDPVACPDCVEFPQPNFVALCESGQCTPRDLRSSELSACNTKDDCRLRWGSGCCETCSGTALDLVALNKNANLEQLMCGPAGDCPPCLPQPFPAGTSAECVGGHCQVLIVQD